MQAKIATFLVCALTAAVVAAPAFAAEGTAPGATTPPAAGDTKPVQPGDALSGQADPCRAEPEDNASNGSRPGTTDQQATASIDDGRQATDKLEACGGVLKPPRNGATDMVEPAPDVGRTPVIPPEQLPGQQAPKP
jgi:hypothetical protein